MRKNVQVFKRILSVMLCLTLVASCLQQVSFVVYAEEVRTPVTRDVTNQEEFIAALLDEDVEIIENSISIEEAINRMCDLVKDI